jgi:DNA-binding NarL/FixJ family response regulator
VSENQHSDKAIVVSVGTLRDLLRLREEILRSAGYKVLTIVRPEEALPHILSGACGVLLLCYSVPDDLRRELIRAFRERCPQGHVVGITNYPVVQLAKGMDELVYGIEGPEALIQAIERASAA